MTLSVTIYVDPQGNVRDLDGKPLQRGIPHSATDGGGTFDITGTIATMYDRTGTVLSTIGVAEPGFYNLTAGLATQVDTVQHPPLFQAVRNALLKVSSASPMAELICRLVSPDVLSHRGPNSLNVANFRIDGDWEVVKLPRETRASHTHGERAVKRTKNSTFVVRLARDDAQTIVRVRVWAVPGYNTALLEEKLTTV